MSRAAPKHFLTLSDIPRSDWPQVLAKAQTYLATRGDHERPLAGKSVVLIFEKALMRTRLSFEIGVHELGGYPVVLGKHDTQLGRGEPIADTARVISRYAHGCGIRTFGHERVEEFARHSTIPVINMLTDDHHPCQLAADLLTVLQAKGDLTAPKYAWVGDGNNMAHSWIEAAGVFGLHLVLACPEGYRPKPAILAAAQAAQAALGRGSISMVASPKAAVAGADVISTDVWTSMGQEAETAARAKAFAGYLIDEPLLRTAAPDAMVLHCLPAHRGEEIAAEVIDGKQSHVWDQAEMRLHAQKAILWYLMSS
ncbi:MAG: ornithine carbamoyltransferase [Myxococcales bacterium]|nr:ornithine carbamoyltransferase [Myxococcales bacterium]